MVGKKCARVPLCYVSFAWLRPSQINAGIYLFSAPVWSRCLFVLGLCLASFRPISFPNECRHLFVLGHCLAHVINAVVVKTPFGSKMFKTHRDPFKTPPYPSYSQLLGSQRLELTAARPAMSLAGAPGIGGEALEAPGFASAQAPGSASAPLRPADLHRPSPSVYRGSRKEKQRFEYDVKSTAGFVELSPLHVMTAKDLHDALTADPAITRVVHNSTKSSQGNFGNHYMEQNLLAHVVGFPDKPVEFELTRHQHMKPVAGRPFTVTACFKPPPKGMEAVAWQILLRIVHGMELMPEWARSWARAATKRASQRLAEEAEVGGADASGPGSASPAASAPEEPPLKRSKYTAVAASSQQEAKEEDKRDEGPQQAGQGTVDAAAGLMPRKEKEEVVPQETASGPGAASSLDVAFEVQDQGTVDAAAGLMPRKEKEEVVPQETASVPGTASSQDVAFEIQDEEPPGWSEDSGQELSALAQEELQQPAEEDEDTARGARVFHAATFLAFNDLGNLAPAFAEAVERHGMAEDSRTVAARAMQANVLEHVRWRPTDKVDDASRDGIAHMRSILQDANEGAVQKGEHVPDMWDLFRDRVDTPHYLRRHAPGSASATPSQVVPRPAPVSPCDFLDQASKRSLGVVAFKGDKGQALRSEYRKLFEQFPESTSQKFPPGQLDTADGCAHALIQLATSLHKGEVAELDPEREQWRLVAKAPGSASAPPVSQQFFCVPGGEPVRTAPDQCHEFGPPSQFAGQGQIELLQGALDNAGEKDHSDYEPDWPQQRYRGILRGLLFEIAS